MRSQGDLMEELHNRVDLIVHEVPAYIRFGTEHLFVKKSITFWRKS
jgi:hypothetical protein